jgi:hypothetical protein
MDRERIIEQIQDINSNHGYIYGDSTDIYELAILNDKELLERLVELNKTKNPTQEEWNAEYKGLEITISSGVTPVHEVQCWNCKEDVRYTDIHSFCPECLTSM